MRRPEAMPAAATAGSRRSGSSQLRRSEVADDGGVLILALLVLTLCFATGGSSTQTGLGIMLAELLALPLLAYALWRVWQRQRMARARWALIVALAIACLPLLQLFPLPESLWHLSPARVALREDLAAFGVHDPILRWSLTPAATERNFYALLPAIALFLVPLAIRRQSWQTLLRWIVGLAIFTLLLAFVQLGMPQDSFVNPFPEYEPSLSGVFANKNHQASALAIGLVLALALLLEAYRDSGRHDRSHTKQLLYAALVVLLVLVLPLVKSRAGMLISMVACGMLLLTSGLLSPERWRASRAARVLAVLAIAVLAVGTWGAFAWMQSEAELDSSRWDMFTTTLRLGFVNAPFGSGFGSFVPMFEQATGGSLMRSGYINNAHNEYVQWWFEGGVAAVAAMLAALSVLLTAVRRLLQRPESSSTRRTGIAAACALLVLLLHSTVDYPMRAPALMAVAGLLAGIVVATALPEQKQIAAGASAPPFLS